jgi:hypothetical protein
MFESAGRGQAVWSARCVPNVPINISGTTCEIFTPKWVLCSGVEAG